MKTATSTLLDRAAGQFRGEMLWVLPEADGGLRSVKNISVMHSFRPDFLALQRMGVKVSAGWPTGSFDTVALTLPRQVDWACGLLAGALDKLRPGGLLLATAQNDSGGRRYAALLEEHFTLSFSDSKNHCRLAGFERSQTLPDVVAEWRDNYRPKPVAGTMLVTLPGTFSCDHIDAGSALLARHLPPLSGRIADFGAGWGYLSCHLLQQTTPPAQVDLYEADENALAMARINLEKWPGKAQFFCRDLLSEPVAEGYDAVVMNPPFHVSRAADPALGRGFIEAASKALKPGGALFLVANRRLPYEEVLEAGFASWNAVAEAEGFKVLHAVR